MQLVTNPMGARSAAGVVVVLVAVLALWLVLRSGWSPLDNGDGANCFTLHLYAADAINESLLVETRLCQRPAVFLVDTGYAGPPVLSASYLVTGDAGRRDDSFGARYAATVRRLEEGRGASEIEQHRAVARFLREQTACKAFTSGCTMRLMSIGATQEQQADMMLCPLLEMKMPDGAYRAPRGGGVAAEVFVTNPLPTSVHILTCDYLVHISPVLLDVRRGRLCAHLDAVHAMAHRLKAVMYPMELSGGAFLVPVRLGGEPFRLTVDTGAPGPVSLGASAAARLTACRARQTAIAQEGVNGEEICSEVVLARLEFAHREFEDVPVFVNDREVGDVDGYMGMGVLRAFNILITSSDGIGFAANGLPLRSAEDYAPAFNASRCGGADAKGLHTCRAAA